MKFVLIISIFFSLLLVGCQSATVANKTTKNQKWLNTALANDIEFYTDTANIRFDGATAFAREKRIYLTAESRKLYVDKIRDRYTEMKKPEKADKWNDFSYCIYECEYDCTNQRFRTLSVEDFDSQGNSIIKIVTQKKNLKWLNVERETIGDYTFFFVCDYQQ